jgi:hypothetical protein
LNEFVGISLLSAKHAAQVDAFQAWVTARSWESFHTNHYDWWTFPIDRPSSHGFKYTVGEPEVAQLKANRDFMAKLRLGAQLMLLSWGWDWQTHQPVPDPDPNQAWARRPIRLEKCTLSMELFGHHEIAASCKAYMKHLVAKED